MPELAIVQNEQSQRLEVKLRRELGDAILSLLDDDAVEDIVLNPDASLWAKQMGSGFTRVGQMSGSQAVCAMNTIASMRSMILNYERPVLETELPLDGSRFEGLIPPVVSILFSRFAAGPDEYLRSINTASPAFSPVKPTP